MNEQKKILLLGGTGRTGKLFLRLALEKGYRVKCLSRNSERIKKRVGLEVFEGNPVDKTDLRKAMWGCDHVISFLNISRSSDFPWARLRTPEKYLSDVMKVLVPIAQEMRVKRMVVCSAWGVAETKKDLPKWFSWLIDNSNIGFAYRDHERQESILSSSKLLWTIVRPVGLTNSRKSENIKMTFNNVPRPSLLISRQSVAKFHLDCLVNDDLIEKKIVISKG